MTHAENMMNLKVFVLFSLICCSHATNAVDVETAVRDVHAALRRGVVHSTQAAPPFPPFPTNFCSSIIGDVADAVIAVLFHCHNSIISAPQF